MPKKRPNPARLYPKTKPLRRVRRKARPSAVKVYDIHCKACKRKYELTMNAEPVFCIYCRSDQIEKTARTRKETPAERAQRKAEFNLHFMHMVGSVINGLFGAFVPPSGFYPQPPSGVRNGSALEAELMKEGYRKLAQKYHPDKGGDPEKMKELNRLKEKLGL